MIPKGGGVPSPAARRGHLHRPALPLRGSSHSPLSAPPIGAATTGDRARPEPGVAVRAGRPARATDRLPHAVEPGPWQTDGPVVPRPVPGIDREPSSTPPCAIGATSPRMPTKQLHAGRPRHQWLDRGGRPGAVRPGTCRMKEKRMPRSRVAFASALLAVAAILILGYQVRGTAGGVIATARAMAGWVQSPTATSTPTREPTATHTPTSTVTATPTLNPTATRRPTATPVPSSWDRYKPGRLSDIARVAANDAGVLADRTYFLNYGDLLPLIVPATYPGEFRPTRGEALVLISFWGPTFFPQFSQEQLAALFQHEGRFLDGDDEYWLPVQSQLIPYMERELRPGGDVILLVVWAGATGSAGETQLVFLVNNFITPPQ